MSKHTRGIAPEYNGRLIIVSVLLVLVVQPPNSYNVAREKVVVLRLNQFFIDGKMLCCS
jgi:hypothetical protein